MIGTATAPLKPLEQRTSSKSFQEEVLQGLGHRPKTLPCKFFYDKRGSQLFDRICELEEYYPTRTEMSIMRRFSGEMATLLGKECLLVEYGSGSSLKTRILLDAMVQPAGYVPIDISEEHLKLSAQRLAQAYPHIEVLPVCADYTQSFALPRSQKQPRGRCVYFPGSTIGNFEKEEALGFLRRIAQVCGEDGSLLIGVDLKKDPAVLSRAYNDSAGVTAEFNLNILRHINSELDADFDLAKWEHVALYNQRRGRIEMYLESAVEQRAHIADCIVRFERGETIHTENSHKYTPEEFADLAAAAGFERLKIWMDEKKYFSVQYFQMRLAS